MHTLNLNVEGMSCRGCEKSIRTALKERTGVSDVKADHEAGKVTIVYDETRIQAPALITVIEDAGFDVAGDKLPR